MADSFPLLGLHDRAGGEFLAQQGLHGWCLDSVELGLSARPLDYSALALSGVRVLVQLTHGSGGAGTLPTQDQYSAFAGAVLDTIDNSSGVYGFIIGNELNNPNEWPGGERITPEQYGLFWNMIWFKVPTHVPLIPAPIDPYYGPDWDSREYWPLMLQAILRGSGGRRGGADGLAFHPKVQWHDKSLVRSDVTFTDPPLIGLPYHWRAWHGLYDVTPSAFTTLPIYLSGCRPELQTQAGPPGWRDNDDGLIAEMLTYERQMNIKYSNLVSALLFYRWAPGPWSLNKPSYIAALKDAAKDAAMEHGEVLTRPAAPFTWPTESRVVTQSFGANPEFYGRFNLPGHEGVDIRAGTGSRIFAAYDGVIIRIEENNSAYGYTIRERIQLAGHTYELIYAHGLPDSRQVVVGQRVQAGQWLMLADSSGNALGPHLHFGMKEPGATYVDKDPSGNDRVWPLFLRDPSPFLGI